MSFCRAIILDMPKIHKNLQKHSSFTNRAENLRKCIAVRDRLFSGAFAQNKPVCTARNFGANVKKATSSPRRGFIAVPLANSSLFSGGTTLYIKLL